MRKLGLGGGSVSSSPLSSPSHSVKVTPSITYAPVNNDSANILAFMQAQIIQTIEKERVEK